MLSSFSAFLNSLFLSHWTQPQNLLPVFFIALFRVQFGNCKSACLPKVLHSSKNGTIPAVFDAIFVFLTKFPRCGAVPCISTDNLPDPVCGIRQQLFLFFRFVLGMDSIYLRFPFWRCALGCAGFSGKSDLRETPIKSARAGSRRRFVLRFLSIFEFLEWSSASIPDLPASQ